ncbi:MAG: TraB domain-containing protein [Nanoarchaeota archaeon]|nr:TraB domain-containing protein [Nanoarchaeota archaeon]
MWKIKNLVVVGTSHIEKKVHRRLDHVFQKFRPKVVALELDLARYRVLYDTSRRRSWSFAGVLGWFQDALGASEGVAPGADMRAADMLAKKYGAVVVCVDRPVQVTLQRLKKSLSWREKLLLLKDMLFALVVRPKVVLPKSGEVDRLMEELKFRFPNVYEVLVVERDEVLGKALYNLMVKTKGKVLAVVGAGHSVGVKKVVMECLRKKS